MTTIPLLYVEKLSYKSNGPLTLHDISLKINKGQCLLLSGANGSGKSTLLHILAGLIRPCQGQVWINGLNFSQNRVLAKQQLGVLPEHLPLYPELRVSEYLKLIAAIRLAKPLQKSAVSEIVSQLNLEPYSHYLIQQLSRGLKQRVGLAQALIHKPSVLLLDEPTNGLDPSEVQNFKKILTQTKHQMAIVLATHVLSDVAGLYDQHLELNRHPPQGSCYDFDYCPA